MCSPMNLVTGLWGMNVHVPGQDVAEGVSDPDCFVDELIRFSMLGLAVS